MITRMITPDTMPSRISETMISTSVMPRRRPRPATSRIIRGIGSPSCRQEGEMKETSWRVVVLAALAFALACGRVEGQSARVDKHAGPVAPPIAQATSDNPDIDGKALAIFNRMTGYVSTLPAISVVV